MTMWRDLLKLLRKHKEYIRVDLVMYGVMILLIIAYFIYVTLIE